VTIIWCIYVLLQEQEVLFKWPLISIFQVCDQNTAFVFEYVREGGRKPKQVKLMTPFVSVTFS
jgi:hypothetical protein